MRAFLVGVCLVALSAVAMAQDPFDGKWTGTVPAATARGAATPVTLTFKAEGMKLTGTMVTGAAAPARGRGRGAAAAPEVPLADGVISGNGIHFKTTQLVRGETNVYAWAGFRKDDDLTLSRTPISPEGFLLGPAVEVSFKRATP